MYYPLVKDPFQCFLRSISLSQVFGIKLNLVLTHTVSSMLTLCKAHSFCSSQLRQHEHISLANLRFKKHPSPMTNTEDMGNVVPDASKSFGRLGFLSVYLNTFRLLCALQEATWEKNTSTQIPSHLASILLRFVLC